MPVPAAILPHLPEGVLRHNFDGQANLGAIEVDLHVFTKSNYEGRAHVRVATEIGNVVVRLVRFRPHMEWLCIRKCLV
jgi:hypothetical protein